ncbi:hypothetical protein HUJ05_006977 [Dendroctonus ponderosae]|nr:hypothetical protein HUJ05_006977 [Dendroctonus ponderosae]
MGDKTASVSKVSPLLIGYDFWFVDRFAICFVCVLLEGRLTVNGFAFVHILTFYACLHFHFVSGLISFLSFALQSFQEVFFGNLQLQIVASTCH